MENYFPKIQGLHLYTDDIVGMVPLNRQVMLLMLHSEACVQSLLRGREGGSPVQLESIWLPDDGGPDLSTSELKNLVKVSSNWKRVSVEARGGSLFYEVKETR
jgi:hypothetical protein